jgi:hypothetical protein
VGRDMGRGLSDLATLGTNTRSKTTGKWTEISNDASRKRALLDRPVPCPSRAIHRGSLEELVHGRTPGKAGALKAPAPSSRPPSLPVVPSNMVQEELSSNLRMARSRDAGDPRDRCDRRTDYRHHARAHGVSLRCIICVTTPAPARQRTLFGLHLQAEEALTEILSLASKSSRLERLHKSFLRAGIFSSRSRPIRPRAIKVG